MTRIKVLINGAGIAGNALAFWLAKLGHDVTVLERFPDLRATGLQLDLRGHGIQVLKRMGLEEAFRSKLAPEQGIRLVDSAGRQWAYFGANKSGKGLQSFTTEYEIMRGDLCRLLYDAAKDGTRYIFGTSVEKFEDKGNEVEVRLTNGTTERFDLVVGADGQGSRTRKMLLGPDAANSIQWLRDHYIGYYVVPRPMAEGEEYNATVYMATEKRIVMVRRHSPSEIQAYLVCKSASERLKNARPGDVAEEKEAFREIFQGAGWEVDELLEALKDSDSFYCERLGVVKVDSWSQGRVTLLGDAAYCPTATTGMGTTAAIVGAYVLAGEIGRRCGSSQEHGAEGDDGVLKALAAYQQTFEPFMTQVTEDIKPDRAMFDLLPSGSFGISAIKWIVSAASFLRLDVLARYILREGVKWDLPEYEELLRE